MTAEPTESTPSTPSEQSLAAIEDTDGPAAQIHEELLVEDVSIDGMCGVY